MPPPPPPAAPPPARRATAWACAAVAALILYGSWFPFDWIRPHPDDLWDALTDLRPWTGRADLLGNVALFLPWGLGAALAARAHGRSPRAWALGGGLLLALVGQVGQCFEAHRDPRWADVLWNGVGAALGGAAAGHLPRWRGRADALLLAGSALVAWLPLWPSLDPERLRRHWARLETLAPWQGAEAAMMAGLALVVGTAAAAWVTRRAGGGGGPPAGPATTTRAAAAAALAAALLLAGQLAVPGARLSGGGALGVAVGLALALALRGRPAAVALALAALQVLGGLAPFEFRPQPVQALHWLPFEAMLVGDMRGNAQALARDAWLWGCALGFARRAGWPAGRTALGLAALALAVEAAQCWMPVRTPDLTPALLVLGVAALLRWWPFQTSTSVTGG